MLPFFSFPEAYKADVQVFAPNSAAIGSNFVPWLKPRGISMVMIFAWAGGGGGVPAWLAQLRLPLVAAGAAAAPKAAGFSPPSSCRTCSSCPWGSGEVRAERALIHG
jgi:hypothetical protein